MPLYGDGINLDTDAIQSMLDSGVHEVRLPDPEKYYLIDKPLHVHSNQSLVLPRYATIRLADGSNCHMLENYDSKNGDVNITVCGGIWDYNNLGQLPNPFYFKDPASPSYYDGMMFHFFNVKHFVMHDMTFKDPITFCCSLDTVSCFTVENIRFDFNLGNPRPVNMDGIHLNGNCNYGLISNLQGACYDDLVALNADEGSGGQITHVDICHIYAEECHSAVRLLTVNYPVTDIHISDVHGSYYQYCIGVTKYYKGETSGYFESLDFDHIYACKSPRYDYLHVSAEVARNMYVFPLIWVEENTVVHSLTIRDLYRREKCIPVSTIYVGENSVVDYMSVSNCNVVNETGKNLSLFDIRGTVKEKDFENNRISGGDLFENPVKNADL